MDDEEILKERADQSESTKGAIKYLSGAHKKERELWVANEFLNNLSIAFDKQELKPINSNAPDVLFRDIYFEVKEILNKGRKRHHEYKKKLKKIQKAQSMEELMPLYEPKEISLQEVVNRIDEEIINLNYSPDFTRDTDILFYVNLLTYRLYSDRNFKIINSKKWQKWRSVSMVMGKTSLVLWVSDDAPEILKNKKLNT